MGQLQNVSWRSAGYAALGTVLAAATVVAVVNSDGVRPTSLTSNSATRWLVDRVNGNVVLVDGLAGRVLAKITTGADLEDEVAVQGASGAFLVAQQQGSVRTISTAKLQLGTAQPVALLTEPGSKFGVGTSGLTVVSPATTEARVVAVDDVSRQIEVPPANDAMVAADGSMWMLAQTTATHVNVDQSSATVPLRSELNQRTTIGAKAVAFDAKNRTVRWLDGADVPIDSLPNASEAKLQEAGDAAPCVWLGADDELACVGATGIVRTLVIEGLHITTSDRLAVAGTTAVVVSDNNSVQRIDLSGDGRLANDPPPTVRDDAGRLTITASGDLIWLDDLTSEDAWVVQRFGIKAIHKDDEAPLLDAQGQVQESGAGDAGPLPGGGDPSGDEAEHPRDENNVQDPPVAVDDSVTARAGNVIIIPVTGNDYDPDGDAIAVSEGDTRAATHGTTDILNGTSIIYRPESGYSGSDSFRYTIVDEHGATASADVSVELFPPDSPNRPPIARPDRVKTRIGRPVTIDVLANDIDPERDTLTVSSFETADRAKITDTTGPTGLPALLYTPPADKPGIYRFSYQAADPQGGTSDKTVVIVEVSSADSENTPPIARPDAIRLSVGVLGKLDVKANDIDEDGDDLTISYDEQVRGVKVAVVSQQLNITLLPGAADSSVLHYSLMDDRDPSVKIEGKVLVLRVDDSAPNRPPVANADSERVVIGNTVKIPVTANDVDPDLDAIRLLSVDSPAEGVGTTTLEGNSVRFAPNLPDITEPTPVTFSYRISDGHGNEAIGNVTVTVLLEALPRAPFAGDDFADTVTNKPVNIDVLANDSDPSGGKPSLIANPICANGGDAVRTPDDRVTFTPPTGDTGTYKCKYTVANTQGLRAEASIIITVTEAPRGNSDPFFDPLQTNTKTVPVGGTLTLTADGVADDPDGDSLVFSSVTVAKPDHGKTNFVSTTSTIVYTAPTEGSADRTPTTDTLNVTISDGNDGNISGTITINVIDPSPLPSTPSPPLTHEILRPATVGEPLPIDVAAELREQNSGSTLTTTGAVLVSGPADPVQLVNGIVIITPTGPGTVVVNYTVSNGSASADNKITLTVTQPPPANPPVAVNDAMSIDSGGSNSIDLLANDLGISDPGDEPTVVLLNRPPADFGSVQLVNSILTFTAAPGAGGSATIRYSLSDGTGPTSSASITLVVLPCGESLPSARTATIFTPYMTPIDIDLRDYVTSGHVRPGSVAGAGLTGITGTYTPPVGMNGTETVTYIVENGCQQTFQGVLTIDVNRAPVGATVNKILSRGSTLQLFVADLASDDEALKITALDGNQPSWVSLSQATGLPGSTDETTIVATPPSNAGSGTYTFNAIVQDPGGLTATTTINLAINNVAPTAIADNYLTDVTDTPYATPDPTINDTDSEPGALTIRAASVISGPGTVLSFTDNTIIVFLPHGTTVLSYTIEDSGHLTSSSTITITSNRSPTFQSDTKATNGQPTVHLPLQITEPDGDPVQIPAATCALAGFGVDILIDPDPGPPQTPSQPKFEMIVTVPDDFNNLVDNVAIIPCTVFDNLGGSATANITITVV
jgi:Bacterial Ig domain